MGDTTECPRSYNAGVDAAAKAIAKRRDDYVHEHGIYDPSTGVTEFPGNGDEYVGELDEIEEMIRSLPAPATDGEAEKLAEWQTIDSAPLGDNDFYLVCCDDPLDDRPPFVVRGSIFASARKRPVSHHLSMAHLTHWMPLPGKPGAGQ